MLSILDFREREDMNLSKRMSSIAQLKAVIARKSKKPDNDRTPYIIKSQLVSEDSEEDMMFNIILSSDYLVRRYLKAGGRQVMASDYTYGLSVDRIMAMQLGHVNSIGMFCPVGLMLSNKETSDSMKYGLRWIKQENVGQIAAMMGDASLALSKALNDVLPEPETFNLMCYFHMIR